MEEKKDKISRKERIKQLKLQIREIGFWNLPSQKTIADQFGVSQAMINRDLKKIVSTFDPGELDEVFISFYETDKKIARELSKMLYQGNDEQKIRAAQLILQLQRSFTELLESWNKKRKVADQLEIRNTLASTEEQKLYEKYYGDKNGKK
ncbi:MAG: hypothetical protein ABIH28_00500 [archaeon]